MNSTSVGLIRRSGAYLLDSVLAFALVGLSQLALFVPVRRLIGIDQDWFLSGVHTQLYTLLTISIPVWMYFALAEHSKRQATVGKRVLGLKVGTRLDGRRITVWRSIARTIVKLLPWEVAHLANNLPVPVWYVPEPELRIGFLIAGALLLWYVLTIVISRSGDAPHDILTTTRVFRTF